MREEVHCNIIRDLLPSYVDELVSGESRELVEAHILGCSGCGECLQKMKEGSQELTGEGEIQEQAVDYLAKIRRYERRLLVSGLVISFFLGAALYFAALCTPQVLGLMEGGHISEYVIRRLELVWWLVALRLVTAGSLVSAVYMVIQVFWGGGALWKKEAAVPVPGVSGVLHIGVCPASAFSGAGGGCGSDRDWDWIPGESLRDMGTGRYALWKKAPV